MLVEACLDSVESARAAERGGAGRIELCDALFDGGTTPSAGMIAACRDAVGIPLFVIVRPRGGGFVYSDAEVDVMLRDVEVARQIGVDGIVIGPLGEGGSIDEERTARLVARARGLSVSFHRAFDFTPDPFAALDTLASLGVDRVLSSGHAPTALEGADTLAALVRHSRGRVTVMAGGSVRESNVREIVERTGVREVHVRATRVASTPRPAHAPELRIRKAFPDDDLAWEETDEGRIRRFVELVR